MELPIIYDIPALASPKGEVNVGGIMRLRIVPAALVQLIAPEQLPILAGSSGHTLSSQHLIFNQGASLSDIDIMPNYCSFTDTLDKDPNGDIFRHLLQIIIPKVRLDVVAWVHKYRAVRFLAFFQDRNGLCRMAGTPEQPLQIGVQFEQPLGFGNNQTIMTFMAAVEQPAYFLTGIEDADLIFDSPFSGSFGFSYDS